MRTITYKAVTMSSCRYKAILGAVRVGLVQWELTYRDPVILFDSYNMGLALQDQVVFPSVVNSFFLLGFANQQDAVIFFAFSPEVVLILQRHSFSLDFGKVRRESLLFLRN